MLRSWDKNTQSKAIWYRRAGTSEDPWVSRWDHSQNDEDDVLYGGNGGRGHNIIIESSGEADVFIRRSMQYASWSLFMQNQKYQEL